MSNIVIDIAAEFTGSKALKKADSDISRLTKSAKKLGAAFGLAFSARAVTQFAKSSLLAFAADDLAAQQLGRTLDNLGLGYTNSKANVENFIQALQKQTGIVDDKLRPAMASLLRATLSVGKAQKLLGLALDVSAGTGKDLESVVMALQKAYLGNTTSLARLGAGLSKAELTSLNFEQVQLRLTALFAGQALAAANSYAGQIAKLNVQLQNAKETIGAGLVQALTELGAEKGFAGSLTQMEQFTLGIKDLIIFTERAARGTFIFGRLLLDVFGAEPQGALARFKTSFKGLIDDMNKGKIGKIDPFASGMQRFMQRAAAEKKAAEAARKAAAIALALARAKAAAEAAALKIKRDSLALDKASLVLAAGQDLFNQDAIQVQAALINKQTELNKLGLSATDAQKLGIANDVIRLTIKQDIMALEKAIAAGDAAAATSAAAKLNTDMAILGTLQKQEFKMIDIQKILDSLKTKDLINLANLNSAIAALMTINALMASISAGATYTGGSKGSKSDFIAPISMADGLAASTDALLEYADAAAARADAFAMMNEIEILLNSFDDPVVTGNYAGGSTFLANKLAAMDSTDSYSSPYSAPTAPIIIQITSDAAKLVDVIQAATQENVRFGNNLSYAGSI